MTLQRRPNFRHYNRRGVRWLPRKKSGPSRSVNCGCLPLRDRCCPTGRETGPYEYVATKTTSGKQRNTLRGTNNAGRNLWTLSIWNSPDLASLPLWLQDSIGEVVATSTFVLNRAAARLLSGRQTQAGQQKAVRGHTRMAGYICAAF